MPATRYPTITQAHPAYEPPSTRMALRWWLVLAGLAVTSAACVLLRPVCQPDAAGAQERGFGVRHEQRGAAWYHCEPWIRRAFRD